jgi:two-component system sensor histidine kinase RegB
LRRREQEVLSFQDRIARQERLGSIVTLAAGAAHEFGSPLATIAIASRELELHASDAAEVVADARLIRSEVQRCSRILEQMSARGAEPIGETPALIELREVIEGVRRGLAPRAQELLHTEVSGGLLRARLPVEAAKQALAALVNNALEASQNGSAVFLNAEGAPQTVRFRVVDTGCGMPPETLNRIAEPFSSTKYAPHHMGLGTFLARVFAERMGGRLVFESEPGKGTQVLLELPRISND